MRNIDERFINDLLDGELSFFLKMVKENRDKLCLAIRNGYINIYYRGGNLLRIEQKKKGYRFHFDVKYCLNKGNDSNYELLSSLLRDSAQAYQGSFELMIREMDSWFAKHPKAEREFQHNLLINNPEIIDIEYQVGRILRLDMLMVKDGKLYIVENKYGNSAIGGKAGIAEHYSDICFVLDNKALYEELVKSVYHIADAKHRLGLFDSAVPENLAENIEVLFLFADYNKRSKGISNEVSKIIKTCPAKLLFMDSIERIIDITKAEDFLSYEN